MNTSQSASQRPAASGSGRRTLVLVFLLGAAPVVGAYLLFYFFPDWIPRSTINHGTLVSPARPLSVEKIVDADGKDAVDAPANPNGSVAAIAGICDGTGRVLGLMPHPDRSYLGYHHPASLLAPKDEDEDETSGSQLFRALVDAAMH